MTMTYETVDSLQLPKIGFGTYSFGGGMTAANRSHDEASVSSLRSALELGYTHFDTAESYGAGHCEELLGQSIRESGLPRESLFMTSKVSPHHLGYDRVLRSCEGSLRRLGMDYIDLYLIHWPIPGMNLEGSFRALNKLVADGKVRHVGVSNFDVKLLQKSQKLSETPILTDQVPYSLKDSSYVKNGVLEYCQSNGILLTAYTPMELGGSRLQKALTAIAAAHSATPHQIALAWLIRQPCVIAIPMSHDPVHQKQNIDAVEIHLTNEEVAQLG